MKVLYVCVLLDAVSSGILMPILPFYAERFGAEPLTITMLFSTFALTQLVASVLAGAYSDGVGRRPVLLVCLAGTTLAFVWQAYATTLLSLFAARAFAGSMAATFAVANAHVADCVGADRRAAAMGRLAACLGLGLCLGPAIAAALTHAAWASVDLRVIVLIAGGVSAVSFGIAAFGLPSGERATDLATPPPLTPRRPFSGAREALAHPAVGYALLVVLAIELCVAGVLAFFPLWAAERFEWTASETGLFMCFIGAVLVIVQGGLVGPLVRRLGEPRVTTLGLALLTLSFVSIEAVSDWHLLLPCGAGICLGAGICTPSLFGFASRKSPAAWQGAVLGSLQAAMSLGAVLGPTIAGASFQFLGPDWPWRLFAGLMMCVLGPTLVVERRLSTWRSTSGQGVPRREATLRNRYAPHSSGAPTGH